MQQGNILRYDQQGNGLISSDGIKYEFNLEAHWQSSVVPTPGMPVSFVLDAQGRLSKLYAGSAANALPVGVVLMDGQSGPGLVICEGKKYRFSLEKEWMSDTPPTANMRVFVETSEQGELLSLRIAPAAGFSLNSLDSDALRKIGSALADGVGKIAPAAAGHQGLVRISVAQVVLFIGMAICWYGLSSIHVINGMVSLNFGQVLSVLSSGNFENRDATTFYNVLGWLALIAIFLPAVWNDARAKLGFLAPAAYMLLVLVIGTYKVYSYIQEFSKMLGSSFGNAISRMLDIDMIGAGVWVGLPFAIVGALVCLKFSSKSLAQVLNTQHTHAGAATASVQMAKPVVRTQPVAAPGTATTTQTAPGLAPAPVAPVQAAPATALACPACQASVAAEDAFCTHCGTSLKKAPHAVQELPH